MVWDNGCRDPRFHLRFVVSHSVVSGEDNQWLTSTLRQSMASPLPTHFWSVWVESWLALLSNGLVWLLRRRSLYPSEPKDRRRGACDNVAAHFDHSVTCGEMDAVVTTLTTANDAKRLLCAVEERPVHDFCYQLDSQSMYLHDK